MQGFWRGLALTAAAVWLLVTPVGIYQIARWQNEAKSKDAYYQKLLSDQAQKNPMPTQEKEPITQLQKKIDELSKQSAEGGDRSAPLAELRQRADALARKSQQQMGTIASLGQALERYRRLGPDAILVAPLSAVRQVEEVAPVKISKDALLVNLQARVSPQEESYASYRLVLRDHLKKIVTQTNQAKQEDDRTFDFFVGRDLLKPGDYTLEIYGLDKNQAVLIYQSSFRIVTE